MAAGWFPGPDWVGYDVGGTVARPYTVLVDQFAPLATVSGQPESPQVNGQFAPQETPTGEVNGGSETAVFAPTKTVTGSAGG